MHAMAKIARQLAIQIWCHLDSGDFGENGNLKNMLCYFLNLGATSFIT